jgi:hypothetical protein
MFTPNKVDGSFHTNPEFTKLYFAYGSNKNWFEIDNFLTEDEYGQMSTACRTATEILQILVEFKVASIGISNSTVYIVFKNNEIKVVNCVRHDGFPKGVVLVPSFYTDPKMPELIPDESMSNTGNNKPITASETISVPDDAPVIVSNNVDSVAGDNVAVLVPDNAPENIAEVIITEQASAEKSQISIPYDEFIDLVLSTDGSKDSIISKIKSITKRVELDELAILKHFLLNEENIENDVKIIQLFKRRHWSMTQERYGLPIIEFENYRKGYLFTILSDRLKLYTYPNLSGIKYTLMSDIIDVINETKPDREVIEKFLHDIAKRETSDIGRIIFHLMTAIGSLYA